MITIIGIVRIAFEVLSWMIIARVILSWVQHDPHNSIIKFVYEITEPVLAPIRRLIPRGSIPIDFSPIIAILALNLLERLVISLLLYLI